MKTTQKYLETLLTYYEEEIMGEAYFYGLSEHFDEKDKLVLLARVERRAADAVVPLIKKYGLSPRSDDELKQIGERNIEKHKALDWHQMVSYMINRYPAYLDEFAYLESMAPEEDLNALNMLTNHEVAAIDFANMELNGDQDSIVPLQRYLC